ncbi:hypothetical protein ACFLRG_03215, partial [Bacteroidota bacterium]
MKTKYFFLAFFLTGLLFSCQKEDSKNDDNLIQDIQLATDKQIINVEELNSYVLKVLETRYSESYVVNAKIAPSLGYELLLSEEESVTDLQVYFNLKGRELGCKNVPRIRDRDEDKKACIEFVYPLTYIMPDGSIITATDKDGMLAIRSWYKDHPDTKEKPTLQYPVDITFKGRPITINNEREMQRIRAACTGDKERDGIKCFDLVYPLTYFMPDRTTVTVNEEG